MPPTKDKSYGWETFVAVACESPYDKDRFSEIIELVQPLLLVIISMPESVNGRSTVLVRVDWSLAADGARELGAPCDLHATVVYDEDGVRSSTAQLLPILLNALTMFTNKQRSNVCMVIIRSVRQLISMLWPHTKMRSSTMHGANTNDKLNRSKIGLTSADGFIVRLFQSKAGFLPRAFLTV